MVAWKATLRSRLRAGGPQGVITRRADAGGLLPEPERRDVDAHVEQAFSLVSAPTSDYPPRPFAPRFFPRLRSQALRLRAAVERRLGDLLYGRGLETAGKSIEVDHFHPDRVWYQASHWSHLPRVLSRRDVRPEDVFVDFGSGKGRVVLQAARYPFARVVGVEISGRLNQIAHANLERQRGKLTCKSVELVTCDAATYEVPDDMTVAYFYYPFVGDTFRRVLANIIASLDRNPRCVRLIYVLPVMEEAILESGRFRLVRSLRIAGRKLPYRIGVYESVLPE
jgi:Histone methylation protein DOT1